MLVHDPHYFAGIHRRAAAESYYAVRFKCAHLLCSRFGARKSGVGRNVGKYGVFYCHLFELIGYRTNEAVVIQEAVGYDKALFLVHYAFQFVQSHRQAAFLYINLFGSPEPQHIFPPFRNRFNVEKMFYTHVFRNRIAAPTAATERQRRGKLKVVKVAYSALRRRRIDKYATGFHAGSKLGKLVLFRNFV